MSFLIFSSNRCYVKSPISCRYLSVLILHQKLSNSAYRNSLCKLLENKENHSIKRSITIDGPSVTENPIRNDKVPFQFPPGQPKDKPRLEHLRFIENQLKKIVNNLFYRYVY